MKTLVTAMFILALPVLAHAQAAESNGGLPLAVENVSAATFTPLLDPEAGVWNDAPESMPHFNRTPPLYVGDATDTGERPEVHVRLLRTGEGSLVLRARWADAEKDLAAGGTRYPDSGDKHIYKEHSEQIAAFADAFCVMVPVKRGPQSPYPAMMMGEKGDPVELYYWRAGLGLQLLSGHGRASTTATTKSVPGRAVYANGAWTVTLPMPKVTPGTPLCFAVWEGHREQRDGLKYFSLWYEAK